MIQLCGTYLKEISVLILRIITVLYLSYSDNLTCWVKISAEDRSKYFSYFYLKVGHHENMPI